MLVAMVVTVENRVKEVNGLSYMQFGGMYCLHIQAKMEAAGSSEMLVTTNKTT
jgi:hypothetical protein